jgi:hypothetical protein
MMKKIIIWIMVFGIAGISCTEKDNARDYPVFGTDPVFEIGKIQDSSEALIMWAERGIQDAVLVHVDAHDSLEFISPEKIEGIRGLIGSEKQETSGYSRGMLLNKSNYLYAAVQLGIVKEIYWVLPYRLFDDIPLAEKKIKELLKTEGSVFRDREIDAMKMQRGCLAGTLTGANIHVCSPRTLHAIKGPAVMDIDVGFFPVYADEYGVSKLRALKWFFDEITFRKIPVVHVSVSYGIEFGLTDPIHRYIGDETIEGIGNPQVFTADSPPELWKFRDMAENMISGGEDRRVVEYLKEPLLKYPDDLPLRMIHTTATLLIGGYDDAFKGVEGLCEMDGQYCYGFVYLGNILGAEKKYELQEKFFSRAQEKLPGSAYVNMQHMLFLYDTGRYREALSAAEKLPDKSGGMNTALFIGDCLYMLGEKEKALEFYEKAIGMYHERKRYDLTARTRVYLDHMAKLYEERGQKEKADSLRRKFSAEVKGG